ncbi:MAG: glutamate synthase subunit beta [Burkholderiales bacterium]|jgi:glutamate synthase (NADPH/NADH) small chain|nr:glutamate synthase subunit beta [Burkholderiales bacterium]
MGKATGFIEYERLSEHYEAPERRIKNYREFVAPLTDAEARTQAARCMDCGTPFCHNGCPINNIIPDFNDLIYHQQWRDAYLVLDTTNNFPEITGRICPALCEEACTLNINNEAVGIKSIERAIIEKALMMGWITPRLATQKSGKHVAVVGSGPAGLACAQQLARSGHSVIVFEKRDHVGGLLRYGIPDFKLEKSLIDRRVEQMQHEGVIFQTSTMILGDNVSLPEGVGNDATKHILAKDLLSSFDAIILAAGSEVPRNLPIAGRELNGVHYAIDFLALQNKAVSANEATTAISAKDKNVIVIGGGDTGSDCVGTSIRQGAKSVVQFELLPQPPEHENKPLIWPYWPTKLRTSSSHEEGCTRYWSIASKAFKGKKKVESVDTILLDWQRDPKSGQMQMREIAGSEQSFPADLVLLAMGFVHPVAAVLDAFGVAKDARNNAAATTNGAAAYRTNVEKVFAAGDVRRGQSLVVWAIREGRECARAVDDYLKSSSRN